MLDGVARAARAHEGPREERARLGHVDVALGVVDGEGQHLGGLRVVLGVLFGAWV